MRAFPIVLFALCAPLMSPTAQAGEQVAMSGLIFDPPPVGHMDPVDDPRFAALDQELRYLIVKRGDVSVSNHFCVVGYRFGDGEGEAAVHWYEARQLIRWGGHREPDLAKAGLQYANSLFFSKAIDLDSDLVDKPEDAGLSTFLTLRSQAEAVIDDCAKHGKAYTVPPFTPPEED